MLLAALAILLPVVWFASCPATGTYFEWQFHYRLRTGMTLTEAEAVLGPATKEESCPGLRHDDRVLAAVRGDSFYTWESDGNEIWVGVSDGQIIDKWFDFPSL